MQFWESSLETALKRIPIRGGPHQCGYSVQMFLEFGAPEFRGKSIDNAGYVAHRWEKWG